MERMSRSPSCFRSFAMGGFEGSTHRRRDRRRIDTIASSAHDLYAGVDYGLIAGMGLRTVREALRWHLIEPSEGRFDWSSVLPIIRAAREHDVEIIWDICHWGVPDDVEVMSAGFPRRLAAFTRAALRFLRSEGSQVAGWVPVNEMSFWTWAGGDKGHFEPWLEERGWDLKRQLFRAHLSIVEELRRSGAREPVVVAEPLINVVPGDADPETVQLAHGHNEGSFEVSDWLLAEDRGAIDVIGLNHYPHNQWIWEGPQIGPDDHRFRPLSSMLRDTARRFGKPVMLAETGAEEPKGDAWLAYVAREVGLALDAGVQVEGVCVYPVMDYQGWDNDRHVPCGPIRRDAVQGRHVRPGQQAAMQRLDALREGRRNERAA